MSDHVAQKRPNGWSETTVGDSFRIVGGGTPSTQMAAFWRGRIPWISSADIGDDHRIRPRRFINEEAVDASAANLVSAGSVIVVTRVGLGKVGLTDSPLSFSQDCHALVFDLAHLDVRFVMYQMALVARRFRAASRGTTISGITKQQLQHSPFLLPPVAEQSRVVAAIDSHLSRIGEAEVALERVRRNLKRYRAAVLQAAVEGWLVPTEAELARAEGRDYEPASELLKRILVERRRRWEEGELAGLKAAGKAPKDDKWKAKYNEPAVPEPIGLPDLPEGWCWVRLDAVSEVQLGQQRAPIHASADVSFPYVRAANITWAGLELSDVKRMGFPNPDRYRLQYGDVLLSEASGSPMEAGKPVIWRDEIPGACYQKTLLRVRTDDKSAVLPEYLRLVFLRDCLTGRFARLAPGVGIVHLTAERLLAWAIPLPPTAEQRRIVSECDATESLIDHLKAAATEQRARLSRLRQAILKWAFEGKLVDQDPNDEPASVLLHRIRAERAAHVQAPTRRSRKQKAPTP